MRVGVALGLLLFGCGKAPSPPNHELPPVAAAVAPPADAELERCQASIRSFESEPALPGTPELDAARAEVFGRARGEPLIWLRAPRRADPEALPPAARITAQALRDKPGYSSVKTALTRHRGDRATLRGLVLREGYVYADGPHEALALVTLLELTALFDEPAIVLQRGAKVFQLRRTTGRFPIYRHVDGRPAELLLGDRVALTNDQLAQPLHRDLRALSRDAGFDRARIARRSAGGVLADLRFGEHWVKTLLASDGAQLTLVCHDAPRAERERIAGVRQGEARRRAALARLRAAIDEQVAEAVPFDRPKDEKTAERDGQLRPVWRFAYLRGQPFFSHEEVSYPVFDPRGRPLPPQMCVDFVLDSFERASGTWFSPRGGDLGRKVGGLDFDQHGIKNRRSVLAFETFASEHPELFEHQRLKPEERIPFGERQRFFRFLLDQADRFKPGDVVAIQGKKADGLIHQHAILIEDTDPLTGFPDALADQMKRPRRRTWEGIMAEAPLRSLLFHVRPKPAVLDALAAGGA
ncbi:MAG: hypothetical protein L6Q84_34570 [Polyangiaceae bacterium]|nr:hypothetical protein [Polyangiaceae bacterium]